MPGVKDPAIPEPLGQIPPGHTGTIAVNHRLDKRPVVITALSISFHNRRKLHRSIDDTP